MWRDNICPSTFQSGLPPLHHFQSSSTEQVYQTYSLVHVLHCERKHAFLIGQVIIVPPPISALFPQFCLMNATLILGFHAVTPTLDETDGFTCQSQLSPSYSLQNLINNAYQELCLVAPTSRCLTLHLVSFFAHTPLLHACWESDTNVNGKQGMCK